LERGLENRRFKRKDAHRKGKKVIFANYEGREGVWSGGEKSLETAGESSAHKRRTKETLLWRQPAQTTRQGKGRGGGEKGRGQANKQRNNGRGGCLNATILSEGNRRAHKAENPSQGKNQGCDQAGERRKRGEVGKAQGKNRNFYFCKKGYLLGGKRLDRGNEASGKGGPRSKKFRAYQGHDGYG